MPYGLGVLTYQDLLEIGLSPDLATLEQLLVRAAGELGYGLAGGALVRGRLGSAGAVVRPFGNPPEAFLEESRAVDVAVRDPVLTALLGAPGLVVYDQTFYVQAGAAPLWDVQAPFGYREGMAVSMHEPGHAEVFTFGVDGSALPSAAEARLRLEADLRLVCASAQEAARRLCFPATQTSAPALSSGETEALRWAADGVAIWVAGDKMRISNRGVEQLLGQAQRKLGASTTRGAVLRAIRGGLIDP